MTRRGFIGTGTAFAALAGRELASARDAGLASGKRRLGIGIISDLHHRTFDDGKGLQNCLGIEKILRYLDHRKVDGVVVCGDLTDFGTAEALRGLARSGIDRAV